MKRKSKERIARQRPSETKQTRRENLQDVISPFSNHSSSSPKEYSSFQRSIDQMNVAFEEWIYPATNVCRKKKERFQLRCFVARSVA
jgi:hypothetical protein